jgi:hypothetical protein
VQLNRRCLQVDEDGHGPTNAALVECALYLFKNVQMPMPGRPVCGYCNGCIARFGGKPIDCYNDEIRAQKELMLGRVGGI